MKVSLCTTSMNRLKFLEQTLPRNLADNSGPDVEFVLLNYNSQDGMEEWVRDNMMSHIESGLLCYYRESTATHFVPAHSRNVSMRVATGDILCNVDADNYTGSGFADYLKDVFSRDYGGVTPFANHPCVFEPVEVGGHGRIALFKRDFFYLGGYREDLIGWGEEDNDLNRRLFDLSYHRVMIHWRFLKYINHSDELRAKYIDFSSLDQVQSDVVANKRRSRFINKKKVDQDSHNQHYFRNIGKNWGKATLVKNFSETIELGNPWIGLT